MIKAEELSKGLFSKSSNARKTQATTIMRLIGGLRNFKNGELELNAKESLAIVEAISLLEKGAQVLKKAAKLRLEEEQRIAKRRAEVEKAVNASFFAKLNTVGEHIALLSVIDFHKIAWFDDDRIGALYSYQECHQECLKSMIDSIAYRPEPAVEQLDRAWSTFQEKLPSLKQKHAALILRITELLEQDKAGQQKTVNRI
ncbi:hypothetical protein [Delftia tsuruhatensis]|uniref:hypothetical protein n=1 Tax=Delftia tsuruhatensis TaxID=180282 RepID=UPI002AD35DCA|nr:hypothetical protein [Delftia tsuruhatensis]WQM85923.1 hypothetical protein RNT40_14050 [Delftia tsuruhatensis]